MQQPPGWSPPPQGSYPPPQGYAPPPGVFGQPPQQQGGYGPPQYNGFGPPQAGYGAAPPQNAYGAPPQTYGAPPPQPYGPPAGGFGAPMPMQMQPAYGAPAGYGMQPGMMQPARNVGIFSSIPCPHCGALTTSHAPGATAARWAGGLVGWLVMSAFATKHYCPSHGEVPKSSFPAQHQSSMTTRMLLKLGVAGGILFLIFAMVAVGALSG